MNIAVDIAVIITPIVIGIGFIFAYKHWKAQEKQTQAMSNERMTQIVLKLMERWESDEIRKSRQKVNENASRFQEVFKQADEDNSEDLYHLVAVGNYFDTLGMLVMEGCLSCSVAHDLFSESLEHYYSVYRPLLNSPEHVKKFRYFIQLHEAFINEEARRSNVTPRPVV